MEIQSVSIALGLTLLAGLSTGLGSALAFFAKRTNTKLLSVALGFSAGVMIYVSFVELFPEARQCLVSEMGEVSGYWIAVLAFFAGIIFIGVIDNLRIWNRTLDDSEIAGLFDEFSTCGSACIHDADNNPCDGVISTIELMAYITVWIGTPGTSIKDLMEVINLWRG